MSYDKRQDVLIDVICDVIERGDTRYGHGAALADELVEKLSSLDPVVEKVAERIIGADRDGKPLASYDRPGGFWSSYYQPGRPSSYAEAREKLAAAFGAAVEQDLRERAAAADEGAKRSSAALDAEHTKLWRQERIAGDLQNALEHAEKALQELMKAAPEVLEAPTGTPGQIAVRDAYYAAIERLDHIGSAKARIAAERTHLKEPAR